MPSVASLRRVAAFARNRWPESPEYAPDQGAQFTSGDFTGLLTSAGIKVSMDGRGRLYDNIFVERLWRSVKYEEVYLHEYRTVTEARERLAVYFRCYNEERLHETLSYLTPHEVCFGTTARLAPVTEAMV